MAQRLTLQIERGKARGGSAMSLVEACVPTSASRSINASRRGVPARSPRDQADMSVVFAQTSARRVDLFERLSVRTMPGDDFIITHLRRKDAGHGMTELAAKRESWVACVHLEKLDSSDIWCDGAQQKSNAIEAGSMHINDMRQSWQADIRSPFEVVNFCVPRSAFDEISSEEGSAPISELHCPIDLARADIVLKNFAQGLLPALAKPDRANRLFADHAARAVTAHLAKTYGAIQFRAKYGRGGLAPWQERRAKEMLRANLSGDLGLPELASACRLSSGHFSRAFKQTVGCPPHQWLLRERIERAKQLILNTNEPLCEIALDTGFVDQSHFTRVFSQRVKASPAAWRRDHGR